MVVEMVLRMDMQSDAKMVASKVDAMAAMMVVKTVVVWVRYLELLKVETRESS